MKAVGVGKMCVGAPVSLRRAVHQIHKIRNASGNGFGNHVGAFIGRADQRTHQQIVEIDFLANLQPHGGGIFIPQLHGGLADGHGLVHVTQLNAQQHRKDFRGGCGVHHLVGIFLVDDIAAAGLDQDDRRCIEHIVFQDFRMLRIIGRGVRRQRRLHKSSLLRQGRCSTQQHQHRQQAGQQTFGQQLAPPFFHHMHSITTQIIPFSMPFVQFYIQRSGLPALKCPLRLVQPCL